jgi:hypothetical protein
MKKRRGRSKGRSSFLEDSRKAAYPMPANEILQEAKKLHKGRDSLDLLAEQHAPISKALSILSG